MNVRDKCYPNKPDWLTRPARKQVDDATLQKELQARGGPGEVNLWSGRRLGPSGPPAGGPPGGRGDRRREASKYRCVLELDVGRTRGSDAGQHMFCIYFAKGCCSQGSACTYLHRLPTAEDEAYAVRDMAADIFGREKRGEREGYRKGAGTFERDNRTVFVSYEGAGSYDLPKIRQLLEANFRQFGPVNNIYISHPKNIAFVRYDWRSSAEFAKEAMHKQGLAGSTLGEVLTTRWASEDPNPVAVVAVKRAAEDAFGSAVASSWEALPPEQKQARIQQLQLASALRRGQAVGHYPATDTQFEEQERQRQLLRQQQQQQQTHGSEYDDWEPYIPDEHDTMQAQQREQQQGQQQGGAGEVTGQGGAAVGYGAEAGGSYAGGKVMGGPVEEEGEEDRAAVEQQEGLEQNSIYRGTYRAHYNTIMSHVGAGGTAAGGTEASGTGYGAQYGYDPAYYQYWYGQQQGAGEVGQGGAEGVQGDGAAWAAYGHGYGGYAYEAYRGGQVGDGLQGDGGEGGGGEGAGNGGTGEEGGGQSKEQGAEEGREHGGAGKQQGNALSILGAAYASDEDEDE